MDLTRVAERLSQDLQWLVFQAKYCAGPNWSSRLCTEFDLWAGAAAALIVALVAWWLVGRLRAYLAYRQQFKVADAETMNRYRWTGDEKKDVALSGEEIASKIREAMNQKR